MNCFYHPDRPAVAQCSACGKGLCSFCAPQFSPPTCTACFNGRIKYARSGVTRELLVMYGFGTILTFFLMKSDIEELRRIWEHSNVPILYIAVITIFMLYITSGIVAGWKALTSVTPQIFLFLPLLGWVFYFLIKLILAFFVGLVMLPIRTVVCIVQLNRLKTVK
jgi:uncharacterized protein (DUF983 family)